MPVRREPGLVFARSLRRGEADDGTCVHLRPGDQLSFEAGSLIAELDAIEDMERAAASGYVPLTPVLWSWLFACGRDDTRSRYLLAACRRLDAAAQLRDQVEQLRCQIRAPEGDAGPGLRRPLFELIGCVEMCIVGIGRAVDMASRACDLIESTAPLPPLVISKAKAIVEIRNAYEHIEDRAVGQVQKKPNPDALTIFNHQRLIEDDVIEYASHTLDLVFEVPALLDELRDFFKNVARNP